MSEMLAAQYDAYGPPDVLQVRRVPRPILRPGHVLVRVAGSSINGADATVRSGKLKLISGSRFPRGTGFDFTGDVAEVGAGVSSFTVGDAIWGFLNGIRQGPTAAAAEFVVASANAIARRPETLDAVAAAALPGAAGAALGVLRDAIAIQKGERVLIRGAGGGVGTSAVQIARAFGGRVTALVRAEHLEGVRALGAEEAFDYRSTDLRALGQFDVILDPVGKNLRAFRPLLRQRGRMAAMIVGSFSDAAYMLASAVHGQRRVRFVQSPPTGALLHSLSEMVDAGAMRPVIASISPLSQIAEAHRAFEAGGTFGKRVLQLSGT
jgi:NADPH:quinone reductase-like Zn-dependent oxidoreductase